MSDDAKNPLDQLLDLVFFAPAGLVLSARELFPRLAEKGRKQITGQVTTARVVGQFAVQEGQKRAGSALGQVRRQAPPRPSAEPVATSKPAVRIEAVVVAPAPVRTDPTATGNGQAAAAAPVAAPPDADALAIPGYDTLSASQVVQRLGGLSADELEAVRSYEAATRGRKTVLHKVAQLQAAS